MLIPIFPLKLVVYPTEDMNLHIFEDRYKELIQDAYNDNSSFLIPAFLDDMIMPIATEVRLKSIVKRYADGKLDVRVKGGSTIFRIVDLHKTITGKLYSGAEVEVLDYTNERDLNVAVEIIKRITILYEVLKIDKPIPKLPQDVWTFQLGHLAGLSTEQEYELLSTPSESERQALMLEHLDSLIPMVKEMEELRRKAKLNGHFRRFSSPDFLRGLEKK